MHLRLCIRGYRLTEASEPRCLIMRKSDEGSTVSIWEATEELVEGGAAVPDSTEVCVVGGGIAGLTTAYLLAKAGRQVTVVDDGLIGGGETCRTTAHLSNAL